MMQIKAISQPETPLVRLCQGCELPIREVEVKRGESAYCPRCGTQLYRGGNPSLSGNLAITLTCLLLLIPAHYFNFLTIRLVGVMIPASLPAGIWALASDGYPALALLIFFCSSLAPLFVLSAIVVAHVALHYRWFNAFRYSLLITQKLKPWSMIDVFLVSVAVSCFKLTDYADIFIGPALYSLVLLQILTVLLISRVSIQRYWEAWKPENQFNTVANKQMHCHYCHSSQCKHDHCVRCRQRLHHRKPQSIERTWAYTLAAAVAIIPANLIPISVFITNGQRLEDTIFSGVASLVNSGMYGIAAIIFIASIVVPVVKILGLIYLLLAIQFQRHRYHRQRMTIYYVIKWIGKWSVMDLFVISIMLTLIDRGQLLDFTPGYGAVAFGCVVILTMLAAESLDSRLIWDSNSVKEKYSESSNE
ncbi:paraquat-inducible protein A [Vibrio cincinnatiensis]|nr:paraquat-inducible protein A [Vibrio cincinnatiensis]MCG3759969.1 paraquat-inducible protein A [Vibrio cincinnatiensis]MCG3763246.1 paraquat-inducible protein A [Vibrio cincinnatiensis]